MDSKMSIGFIPEIEEIERKMKCDTYGGTVHVEWDDNESTTPYGQFVFFAQFLKSCDLFDKWVRDCPPLYAIPCKQKITDILGTYLLSILSGNKRYSHVTGMRNDSVNPQLLGMTKLYSEDAARRAFQSANKEDCTKWMQNHIEYSYKPLLTEPWILDLDTTVKSLYGHQEGAEVGYNPHKPGRPSHCLHTYMMSETRLILDVEVRPGKQTAASYSLPRLEEMLTGWKVEERPSLVRGDCAFGTERILSSVELLHQHYLFKLKQTKKIKCLISLINSKNSKWVNAGQGWEGIMSGIKLSGWSRNRKVLILRRPVKDKKAQIKAKKELDQFLMTIECDQIIPCKYEYAVLVTSLDQQSLQDIMTQNKSIAQLYETLNIPPEESSTFESSAKNEFDNIKKTEAKRPDWMPEIIKETSGTILFIAQLYRNRATCENTFDELKNQWGWGGFMTKDLHRTQITARIVALTYNWWTLFTRWVDDSKHREGITSRPLMLHGVGRQVKHAGQTTIKLTHLHGKREKIQHHMGLIQNFLANLKTHAERILSSLSKWRLILSVIFRNFLKGRSLETYDENLPPLLT